MRIRSSHDAPATDRLLTTIADDPLEPLILVALGTGARIEERLGLLWDNIIYEAAESGLRQSRLRGWKIRECTRIIAN